MERRDRLCMLYIEIHKPNNQIVKITFPNAMSSSSVGLSQIEERFREMALSGLKPVFELSSIDSDGMILIVIKKWLSISAHQKVWILTADLSVKMIFNEMMAGNVLFVEGPFGVH